MKTILQIHTAQQLIGKIITWSAPSSRWNSPYTGVAKITSVDASRSRPITSETIEGDDLDYAFVEDVEMGLLCYGDGDRCVTFEEVNNA